MDDRSLEETPLDEADCEGGAAFDDVITVGDDRLWGAADEALALDDIGLLDETSCEEEDDVCAGIDELV